MVSTEDSRARPLFLLLLFVSAVRLIFSARGSATACQSDQLGRTARLRPVGVLRSRRYLYLGGYLLTVAATSVGMRCHDGTSTSWSTIFFHERTVLWIPESPSDASLSVSSTFLRGYPWPRVRPSLRRLIAVEHARNNESPVHEKVLA